jgi:hypothetical protein
MRKNMEKLDNLVQKCLVGDIVLLHLEDGNYMPKIYAGTLKGKLRGKEVSEELLFVESMAEIKSCRHSRNYLKVSAGFTPLFPGVRVIGYEALKRRSS